MHLMACGGMILLLIAVVICVIALYQVTIGDYHE